MTRWARPEDDFSKFPGMGNRLLVIIQRPFSTGAADEAEALMLCESPDVIADVRLDFVACWTYCSSSDGMVLTLIDCPALTGVLVEGELGVFTSKEMALL